MSRFSEQFVKDLKKWDRCILGKKAKKEAEDVIREIEKLRPRLKKLKMEVDDYRIVSFDLERHVRSILVAEFITLAVFAALLFSGIMSVWFIIPTLMVAVSFATLFILWIDDRICSPYRKILTKKDLLYLKTDLTTFQHRLKAYDDMEERLRPVNAKFERLRPIIEEELNGKLERVDAVDEISWKITLPGYELGKVLELRRVAKAEDYDDLVIQIIDARQRKAKIEKAEAERQAKIRQFEAELSQLTTDPSTEFDQIVADLAGE